MLALPNTVSTPPLFPPEELLDTVLLAKVSTALASLLKIPPAASLAELFDAVLSFKDIVPALYSPPPTTALFPDTTLSVIFTIAPVRLLSPPPMPALELATLFTIALEASTTKFPFWLWTPPPEE